jgi:hypothetical protein
MEGNVSKDNYKAVIADLEKQRAEIDQTIALLRKRAGQSASASASADSDEDVIQDDTFYGKNILQASEMYLKMVGKPARSTEDIAAALTKGGLTAAAPSVATILGRSKGGAIQRVKRGLWGLKEWYSTT